MTVDFRILGDVEVRVQGRSLDVGHARQRFVLGCLVIDVNRPVAADQLIDRVWADDPPHRARNALAAYISRLRHLLADTEGARIVREAGGYVLEADAERVDLCVFRQLASAARAAATPAESATLFDDALACWRGEPLTALDTPWATEVRNYLTAERFSAELDRNDAALAAGRHADLLVSLASASHEHPLDERVAAQLMLAQYRSGRQGDALNTFRRVRERLVDELGIDPGAALQALHQQLLEGVAPLTDPGHELPAVVSAQQPSALPRRLTSFIGRGAEIARIALAFEHAPLVTVTGVGGVGKTRLALEAAAREQQRFAGGVWFCELAPVTDSAVGDALAAVLRLQRAHGRDIDTTVIDFLRDRQVLLVLDNCEHLLDAAAMLVGRIIANCPRVTVLATSREALGVEGERLLPLSPLPPEDAATLFADRARAGRPEFDADSEPIGAVAEICRRVDGIPLAIELAAARVRAMTSLDIARRLGGLRLLSGGARGAHPRQQSLTATIDWSYRLLEPQEQTLFSRLSVFAGGFDLEAAHGVCSENGHTEDDTLEMLLGLVDKSMVVVRAGAGAARYDVLETLRTYGRERLQDNNDGDALARRHARYYIELVERFAAGVLGADERAWVERMTPDAGRKYRALDDENIRTAFEQALVDEDVDLALRLVAKLLDLMNRVGYHAAGWAYRAVRVADPDHPRYAEVVGVAARAAWVLGDFPLADSLAQLAGSRVPGTGTAYLGFPADVRADVTLYTGGAAAATAYYDRELRHARAGADPLRLVFLLDRVTLCHQMRGAPEAGIDAGTEAVRIADVTSNPTARSLARCALARALARDEPEQAMFLFDEAYELAASVENNWLTGMARMESAAIRAEHGDPALSARTFIGVLDHWERGAPGLIPQQWDTLRHVARLLVRLDARAEAARLCHALAAAGREMPCSVGDVVGPAAVDGRAMTGPEAVDFARVTLQRYC